MKDLPKTVDELQSECQNPYIQWYAAGMPTFVTKNLMPWKQIIIKFPTQDDRQAFSETVGIEISEKTKFIFYPEKKREQNILNRVIEDER